MKAKAEKKEKIRFDFLFFRRLLCHMLSSVRRLFAYLISTAAIIVRHKNSRNDTKPTTNCEKRKRKKEKAMTTTNFNSIISLSFGVSSSSSWLTMDFFHFYFAAIERTRRWRNNEVVTVICSYRQRPSHGIIVHRVVACVTFNGVYA